MSNVTIDRTNMFRWHSKHDLYNYFYKHYELDRRFIDNEIAHVMRDFIPRKGQPIKTAELWQKVGLNLEKIHGVNRANIVVDVDMGIMDTIAVCDNDPNKTRRMAAIPETKKSVVRSYSYTDFAFRKKPR